MLEMAPDSVIVASKDLFGDDIYRTYERVNGWKRGLFQLFVS